MVMKRKPFYLARKLRWCMQRVAYAELLMNHKVLLLDEPLAALDLKLRQEMQYELKEIQT